MHDCTTYSRRIELPTGCLEIEEGDAVWPIDNLVGYGARNNPRRPFLFVSRVLGKHIPVRPSTMAAAHIKLANAIPDHGGLAVVFGLAETATALGRGVASALAQKCKRPVAYHQSTRHDLCDPPWFTFEEPHSHASTHRVYRPEAAVAEFINRAEMLILVDDEITSGTTLLHVTRELCGRLPGIHTIVWASLMNWLTAEELARHQFELGVGITVVALATGRFTFTPKQRSLAVPPQQQHQQPQLPVAPASVYTDPARRGILCQPVAEPWTAPALGPGPLTVVGTCEFTYAPYQLALALERAGVDVMFQSTTRSPVLTGGDIARAEAMSDPYGAAPMVFAYNLPNPAERTVVVVYEHSMLASRDAWRLKFGASAWIVSPPCK